METSHLDTLFSAVFGGGLSAILAKAVISKSLRDLEEIAKKVSEIKAELSAIAVKLHHAEKDHEITLVHDRKIAAMENEVYGHSGSAR